MPGRGEANIFGWVLGENSYVMFGMNKVILMIDRSIRKSLSLFIDVSYNNFIIIIALQQLEKKSAIHAGQHIYPLTQAVSFFR